MNRSMTVMFAVLVSMSAGVFGCSATNDLSNEGNATGEARADCSLVRCALPLCAEGQHLATRGNACCPVCVGNDRTDRCATVLCAAVVCGEGEELVTHNNDCCPRCVPQHRVAECATDSDCPQIYCFACPCPTSECQGHRCVTQTADESTCGGQL